jgi:hypothetical protein
MVVSMMRHEWFRPWLEAHLTEVDRVFVSDASDTFFQADPFREFANTTGLLVHDELVSVAVLERLRHGHSWERRCFADRPTKEMNGGRSEWQLYEVCDQ